MILSALPDAQSLQQAALSCPGVYHAFMSAEYAVSSQVVTNQVDAAVLSEAVITIASYDELNVEDGSAWEDVRQFLQLHYEPASSPTRFWNLRRACRLGKLHPCVQDFSRKFAIFSLPTGPQLPPQLPPRLRTLTHTESCRIERSFYRFQNYYNIVAQACGGRTISKAKRRRGGRSPLLTTPYAIFWSKYSSWEVEQLGCAYDFLNRAFHASKHPIRVTLPIDGHLDARRQTILGSSPFHP
jgi:hypothetical protein